MIHDHEYPYDIVFPFTTPLSLPIAEQHCRSLVFQVNQAADPKSEDGIIPSGNKSKSDAVSRTTGAAADKFRMPSDKDRESEDIEKIKRLKYEDEDVGK